jgi:hypothetical protein
MTLPRKPLPIVPGRKWKGKITVMARDGEGYAVSFDAEAVDVRVRDRYVFDRAVLSPKTLKDWTGWEEDKS